MTRQPAGELWAVSFTMPPSFTPETLPDPEDPLVVLQEVPARTMAAVRHSGSWSEKGYRSQKAELETWMLREGLAGEGDPVWARYNSPFSLRFLRRNEILIAVGPAGHLPREALRNPM